MARLDDLIRDRVKTGAIFERAVSLKGVPELLGAPSLLGITAVAQFKNRQRVILHRTTMVSLTVNQDTITISAPSESTIDWVVGESVVTDILYQYLGKKVLTPTFSIEVIEGITRDSSFVAGTGSFDPNDFVQDDFQESN
ncbi:MAG: hypothetical protein K0U41_05805 [Gammaproteobacteria bacterium]|nr:hypothetical protein [Gammaproteobacteria bacterium]